MRSFRYLLCIAAIAISSQAGAQYLVSGQLPGRTRWSQIEGNGFRLIFPEDYSTEALRTASLAESIIHSVPSGLGGHHPSRIPIILNNHNVLTNGVTTWAPKRIELLPIPAQGKYPGDWTSQLLIHEYRHASQIQSLDRGIFHTLGYLAGEQLTGFTSIFIPKWFLEGDATYAETALSLTGRGRTPSFWTEFRALSISQIPISYSQFVYGSYNRPFPGNYTVGYGLVTDIREKYGPDAFNGILDDIPRKFFRLNPFSYGMKRLSGLSSRDYYKEWYGNLSSKWNLEETPDMSKALSPEHEHFTSYSYPRPRNDGSILARKSSIESVTEFVILHPDGSETSILRPGNLNQDPISSSGHYLSWGHIHSDPRWGWQNSSHIRILDLESGQTRKWVMESSLYSPSISGDEKRISAVSVARDNTYSILVAEMASLDTCFSYSFPIGETIQTPVWGKDGESLLYFRDTATTRYLERINLSDSSRTVIFQTNLNLKQPVESNGYVYVEGDFGEVSDIYAIRLSDKALLKITDSGFGAFQPQVKGDTLYYSDYTVNGHQIKALALNESKFAAVTPLPELKIPFQEPLPAISDKHFEITPYSHLKGAFHPHSWMPFYMDNFYTLSFQDPELSPGVMVLSQNLTGDLLMSLGYEYKDGNAGHFRVSYRRFLPVFDFSVDYGGEQFSWKRSNLEEPLSERKVLKGQLRAYLPLYFSDGYWIKQFTPSISVNLDNYKFTASGRDNVTTMSYLTESLSFSIYTRSSSKDLFPKYGLTANLLAVQSPFDGTGLGEQYYAKGGIYLPGLFPHHALRLSASYQRQNISSFYYPNYMLVGRGYGNIHARTLECYSVDYALPLAYPDLSVCDLFFLKRLRGNMFYDYGRAGFNQSKTNLSSAGVELFADLGFLGLEMPVSIGLTPTYRFYDRSMDWSLGLATDLSVF